MVLGSMKKMINIKSSPNKFKSPLEKMNLSQSINSSKTIKNVGIISLLMSTY